MLSTFYSVYNELPCVLNKNHTQNYVKINFNELEQLQKDLEHFYDVIEKLSSEQTPTIHLVVPYRQL